jgi:hypothetical protein
MNRAIHITPIITTDGSEHEKELLYLNKVATRTLDFVFVYMVAANMKTALTNTPDVSSHRTYRFLLPFQKQSSQLRTREPFTTNTGNAVL